MKFRAEIDIAQPMGLLIELIQDPDCTVQWLEGLRSVKHLSGTFRQPGAKSEVVLDTAAGPLCITETVLANELPERYMIRYDGKGYVSYSNYQFVVIDATTTRFIISQEVELKGALKLAGGFLRGTIHKQLKQSVVSFKRFAEAHR